VDARQAQLLSTRQQTTISLSCFLRVLMSDEDKIEMHVETIVSQLVAKGLRDPAWIANAYIERIDPDRKLPDLANGACAAFVQSIARRQLGIAEPEGSLYTKAALSLRANGLRDALNALRRQAKTLQAWYDLS
jgi:hypothetical protein